MMYKGWTVEYCLKMPATRFFAMLSAGRQIEAINRIEDCDISILAQCNEEYFKSVRSRFESRLKKYVGSEIKEEPSEEEMRRPVIEAASPQARDMMFQIFAAKKGLR